MPRDIEWCVCLRGTHTECAQCCMSVTMCVIQTGGFKFRALRDEGGVVYVLSKETARAGRRACRTKNRQSAIGLGVRLTSALSDLLIN